MILWKTQNLLAKHEIQRLDILHDTNLFSLALMSVLRASFSVFTLLLRRYQQLGNVSLFLTLRFLSPHQLLLGSRAAGYSYLCQPVNYSNDVNEVRVSSLQHTHHLTSAQIHTHLPWENRINLTNQCFNFCYSRIKRQGFPGLPSVQ